MTRWRRARTSRGLSLLEVILAIAIFGVAIAVIGELLRMGFRASAAARDFAAAQTLCESKLSELAAGIEAPESIGLTPFEFYPDWQYSIEVGATDQLGLLVVAVTVESTTDDPVTFTLVRWMQDPTFEVEDPFATEEVACCCG